MNPLSYRPIRSFVLRQSRLTAAQNKALQQSAQHYIYPFTFEPTTHYLQNKPLDLPQENAVQQKNQLHIQLASEDYQQSILEIGFGNGDSLISACQENPQTLFFGIEVHLPGVARLIHQSAQLDIKNLRIIRADASQVTTILPANFFTQIRVFFPDPWHKKRHHKRRLLDRSFIQQIMTHLQPNGNGILHIATDWQDYADYISTEISHIPNLIPASAEITQSLTDTRPKTAYEKRGISLEHQIHELIYQRS